MTARHAEDRNTADLLRDSRALRERAARTSDEYRRVDRQITGHQTRTARS